MDEIKHSISLKMATKQVLAVSLCILFIGINLPIVPEPVRTATYSVLVLPSLFASGKEKDSGFPQSTKSSTELTNPYLLVKLCRVFGSAMQV